MINILKYIDEEGNKVVIVGKTTFVYKKMSDVEKAIELSEMREKALHIEATEKAHARAEGEAIGLKEGERRKEAEILAKMRKSGLSEEQIKAILNS